MRVSIITPVLNAATTVADCLLSVAAQTYKDIEHIVIDGGSSDGTQEIIHSLVANYTGHKILKWNSEPDGGIYDAMNKGLQMATGDVVGILNADDCFVSNCIVAALMDAFDDDTDAVYGNVHFLNGRGQMVRRYCSRFFSRKSMMIGMQPPHTAFYCRRECYSRFGGFDTEYRVAGDFEQMLRMIYIGNIRLRYLPLDCVRMAMGGASTSGWRSWWQIRREHLRAYRQHHVPANGLTDTLRYAWKLYEVILGRTTRP